MCSRVMTVADIKTALSKRFANSRKKSYQARLYDYKSGKQFIEMHMESRKVYDELVKHLIDVLHI